MKKILLGASGVLVLGLAAVAVLLQAGMVDVAADTPHSPTVYRLIAWAREQSVMRRAADIVAPADLADAARIRRGAGNYDAMCVDCHLSPGVKDSEIRKGLYPTPPKLADGVQAKCFLRGHVRYGPCLLRQCLTPKPQEDQNETSR